MYDQVTPRLIHNIHSRAVGMSQVGGARYNKSQQCIQTRPQMNVELVAAEPLIEDPVAIDWGIDGKLIDFGTRREVPMRDLALELLEFVDDVVDELGSRNEVSYVKAILADGTSADRQLRVYRETVDDALRVDRELLREFGG